ncbi:MAG: hypothetical protein AABY84_07780 [Candidatus Firestonebacteria bacterium]
MELFDMYIGKSIPEDKKSVAYQIIYRAKDRTLTDEEVNVAYENLCKKLTKELSVEIRR